MQREAEERVREMQERSRRVLEDGPRYPDFVKKPEARAHTESTPRTEKIHTEKARAASTKGTAPRPVHAMPEQKAQTLPHHPIPPPEEHKGGLLGVLGGSLGGLLKGGGDGPISRVMDALGIDNDKIIVLMLLLILLNNNADKKLILALCYILL